MKSKEPKQNLAQLLQRINNFIPKIRKTNPKVKEVRGSAPNPENKQEANLERREGTYFLLNHLRRTAFNDLHKYRKGKDPKKIAAAAELVNILNDNGTKIHQKLDKLNKFIENTPKTLSHQNYFNKLKEKEFGIITTAIYIRDALLRNQLIESKRRNLQSEKQSKEQQTKEEMKQEDLPNMELEVIHEIENSLNNLKKLEEQFYQIDIDNLDSADNEISIEATLAAQAKELEIMELEIMVENLEELRVCNEDKPIEAQIIKTKEALEAVLPEEAKHFTQEIHGEDKKEHKNIKDELNKLKGKSTEQVIEERSSPSPGQK